MKAQNQLVGRRYLSSVISDIVAVKLKSDSNKRKINNNKKNGDATSDTNEL